MKKSLVNLREGLTPLEADQNTKIILKKIQSLRGFTLIELLMYSVLTGVMLVLLGGIGVSILESKIKANALQEINYNAEFLLAKMMQSILSSEAMEVQIVTSTSSVLSLTMADGDKNPTLFFTEDGLLKMKEGQNESEVVSTKSVIVTEFELMETSYSGTPNSVHIKLDLQGRSIQTRSASIPHATYATTVTLKK